MHPTRQLKAVVLATLLFSTGLLFLSCQKQLTEDISASNLSGDITTRVTASVSGFVIDENNTAVQNASVQFGNQSTTTDKYGYFSVDGATVVQNAAFLTVTKAGYFKGIKTFIAQKIRKAFFRIKLIPKNLSGTISGSGGGTVSLSNGLSISLPANAVVTASGGSAYTGPVRVAAYHINPVATDLDMIMPGDLRGINTSGEIKLLKTYGMAAVELTGASGELLQIATGKKATLSLPVPSSLLGDAPPAIPLWYFDETNGLWKEEGTATKTGSNYVGEVAHFSYWNCDYPVPDPVLMDATIVNSSGAPVPYASVWIDYAGGTSTGCHGLTDINGTVQGIVPGNSQLVMKISTFTCQGTSLYSQPFTTSNTNISLGNITLPASSNTTVSGTVVNCSGQPVTNGYIMVMNNPYYWNRYNFSGATGNFTSTVLACQPAAVIIIPGDLSNNQEGNPLTVNVQPGNNTAVGTITACGNANAEFINYSVDNVPYSLTVPAATMYQSVYPLGNPTEEQIWGYQGNSFANVFFTHTNIAPNSSQNLIGFTCSQVTDSLAAASPVPVAITEYGSVGGFIAGNFSGTLHSVWNPAITHAVICSFRIRRQY
ncbi:MAG: carboxypeptidase-like regulatory domain-containing protein [Ferruginibacter sp.]